MRPDNSGLWDEPLAILLLVVMVAVLGWGVYCNVTGRNKGEDYDDRW